MAAEVFFLLSARHSRSFNQPCRYPSYLLHPAASFPRLPQTPPIEIETRRSSSFACWKITPIRTNTASYSASQPFNSDGIVFPLDYKMSRQCWRIPSLKQSFSMNARSWRAKPTSCFLCSYRILLVDSCAKINAEHKTKFRLNKRSRCSITSFLEYLFNSAASLLLAFLLGKGSWNSENLHFYFNHRIIRSSQALALPDEYGI